MDGFVRQDIHRECPADNLIGEGAYFYGGTGYYPFAGAETGSVLSLVAKQLIISA